MTNQQLYLAIGISMLFNAGLIGILLAYINAKFAAIDQRFASALSVPAVKSRCWLISFLANFE
jgi:hypothetical protein